MELSIGLILLCCLFSRLITSRLRLPALIGYLLAGMILGPACLNLLDPGFLELSSLLRRIALIIILCRAGLGMSLPTLREHGTSAVLLCFLPALFEIGGYLLLAGLLHLDLLQAAILGCVMAAVSPAVIVPRMLKIIERNSAGSAAAQCVMAGASMDDVFVITIFSTLMNLSTKGAFSWLSLLSVPVSIVTGAAIGVLAGWIARWMLERTAASPAVSIAALLAVSLLLVRAEDALKDTVPFASLVAVVVLCVFLQKAKAAPQISAGLNRLWIVGEMFLFALVGVFINVSSLESQIAWIVPVMMAALLFRGLGVWVSLLPSGFNHPEKLFVMISYLPKATVQAAIGALPLSAGMAGGQLIFNFACLAILITAPAGAWLIDFLAPRLLRSSNEKTQAS